MPAVHSQGVPITYFSSLAPIPYLEHHSSNLFPYNPVFDILKVASRAQSLPSHSWECGTTPQALLELCNPSSSVFGSHAFHVTSPTKSTLVSIEGLVHVRSQKIIIGRGKDVLTKVRGASADPASLGVAQQSLDDHTRKDVGESMSEQWEILLNIF